ncbi:XRE family transcriptional regulator [Brachybacterium endophyticum]|uniref:XRE family transcriptional regulator n=1 Tax=Brachybacterium endophyticum TaxID=2182385 RepID=A0A2U2RI90_9MICO|nr:helix-turn-helix transcriptional regulator [Brachybacterium endophyticum]PWH05494.1 XRE family transcriptional regulator [Brachybacterium endophyticum]
MDATEPLLRELVGAALRRERRRQGLTLARLAEASGVSMQHLSDVERGQKDPSSEVLSAITGALGISVFEAGRRVADSAVVGPRTAVVLDLTGRTGSRTSRSGPAGIPLTASPSTMPGGTLLKVA